MVSNRCPTCSQGLCGSAEMSVSQVQRATLERGKLTCSPLQWINSSSHHEGNNAEGGLVLVDDRMCVRAPAHKPSDGCAIDREHHDCRGPRVGRGTTKDQSAHAGDRPISRLWR